MRAERSRQIVNQTNQTQERKPPEPVVVNPVDDTEIDLVELFYRMLEKAWWIVAAAVAAAVIAGAYSFFFAKEMYESTAILYVLTSKDSVVNLQDLQIGSQLTNDYIELFNVRELNEQVLSELGLESKYASVEVLRKTLTVGNPANTRHLRITARADNRAEAKDIANTYARKAQRYIQEKMKTEEPTELSIAIEGDKPVSPNKTRNTLLGGIVGAFIAMGVIFLLFVMDDKIKSTDDLAKYAGLPTLAVVPMLGIDSDKGMRRTAQKNAQGIGVLSKKRAG